MNKEEVLLGLWNLFKKLIWLNESRMKNILTGFNPSEIHCIDYIGKNTDSNVTKLAEAFYMTRSALSKLTKKLIEKGIIESYQKPDNKKEIYYKLTEKGKSISEIHDRLHNEFQERDKKIFEQMTMEQYDTMLSFSEKYNNHLDKEIEKLGVDIRSGHFDKF